MGVLKTLTKDEYYLQGIASGDSTIIKEFYQRYFNSIVDYIINNGGIGEDAKDVFQDAIMVIYEKVKDGDFKLNHTLHTFFYSICKNIWYKRLYKKKKAGQNDVSFTESMADFGEDIGLQEQYGLYRAKFDLLGEECKNILNLFFSKKSMKQIAQALNLSGEAYAKKRKYLCQRKLVDLIKSDDLFNDLKNS